MLPIHNKSQLKKEIPTFFLLADDHMPALNITKFETQLMAIDRSVLHSRGTKQ